MDFQRAYGDLLSCDGFNDWESTRRMSQDVLFKRFWCLAKASWKGLKSVGFWGKWA